MCVFAIGTAEFAVAGMLPEVSTGLGSGVVATGQLVTVYAATVVVAGPLLTAVTVRISPRRTLLGCMVIFCAAILTCAVATDFAVMVLGRVGAGLVHGVVFATGLVVAVSSVPPERTTWAVGMVTSGLTLATVIGVPLGTQVATHLSWRWTFWLILLVAAIGTAVLAATLPGTPRPPAPSVARQARTLIRPAVLATLAMTVLGYGAVFTAFTYLAPLVQHFDGGSTAVTIAVAAFGGGGVVGNLVASRTSAEYLRPTLLTAMVLMTLTLAVLPVAAQNGLGATVVDVFLLGAAAFALIPGLQVRILALASDAPTLAAATNVAAFNVANMIGAGIGGVVVAVAGVTWTGPVGACVTLAGVVFTAIVLRADSDNASQLSTGRKR
ncbi:MFS transporter [Pseudonocardia sp. MH-G8]|nr:MFS transporter [Pseudonocardia sp. MH-G8]